MKILWLTAFPENILKPELITIRNKKTHSASWVVNLAKSLVLSTDMELHIVTSNANIKRSQAFIKWGIYFHIIKYTFPFTQRGFPSFFPYDSITWYKSFRKEVKENIGRIRPDMIHAHGIEKGFALCVADSSIVSIVSIQGIYSRMQRIDPTLKGYFQIPIEKHAVRKLSNFGCRTNWDSGFVKETNPEAKIFHMPEMINGVFFNNEWIPNTTNTIVFVGSIIARKGIDDLIDAALLIKKIIPNIVVKLIGSGSQKYISNIKSKIEKDGLMNNFQFLGQQNSDEIADILASSSAFILPSYVDNSPNSLAEAMAVGMPCIASDVGGIPSMIENNKTGIIFQVGNIEDLAESVVKVLQDKELSRSLALEAKKKAYASTYKDYVVEQTVKVYKELLTE